MRRRASCHARMGRGVRRMGGERLVFELQADHQPHQVVDLPVAPRQLLAQVLHLVAQDLDLFPVDGEQFIEKPLVVSPGNGRRPATGLRARRGSLLAVTAVGGQQLAPLVPAFQVGAAEADLLLAGHRVEDELVRQAALAVAADRLGGHLEEVRRLLLGDAKFALAHGPHPAPGIAQRPRSASSSRPVATTVARKSSMAGRSTWTLVISRRRASSPFTGPVPTRY